MKVAFKSLIKPSKEELMNDTDETVFYNLCWKITKIYFKLLGTAKY